MGEVVYTFRPAAQAAIDEKKAELLRARKLNLVDSDYVRREMRAFTVREMWNAQHASDEDALIGVTCASCQRQHIMPGDVKSFRCKCSPHRERPTFINRFPLI